jgi:hypothetical protein
MALRWPRQHHRKQPQGKNPRGTLLAFIAATVQAMLPFFVAVQIAVIANPANADIPICSANPAQHDTGTSDDHRGTANGCPICIAVAASQAFTAPSPILVPLPVSCDRVVLSATEKPSLSLDALSPYQSRGPPSIA